MRKCNREKGVALIFALGMLALLMVLGLAFVTNAVLAQKTARNNSARAQARMFAMSAANRAIASIMLYQQQVYVDEDGMPADFSAIYSYGYKPGATNATDIDGLVSKSAASLSMMRLPEDDSVVAKLLAKDFNDEKFPASTPPPWPGSWVYFYDADGKIVGRAAWQVLSNAPQISAPVFFRGALPDKGPVAQNQNFVPHNNRWGREIDEVYIKSDDSSSNLLEHLDYGGGRIKDYADMYDLFVGSTTDAQKMWLKRWFTPDPDAHDNDKACWNATRMVPETYEYRTEAGKGLKQMLRFNISELSPNTDFKSYGITEPSAEDNPAGAKADPWYVRFNIDSRNSSVINSGQVLERLTQPGETYLIGYQKDNNVPVDERGGLPFLRKIGNDKGSFANLAALRKQIAANFNDYCDADSIPTSDVPATTWMSDAADFVEPTYTGNERTPYLYEIAFQMGMHSFTDPAQPASSADLTKTGMQVETTELNKTGEEEWTVTLTPSAVIRLFPMIKLANLYPFSPGEETTDYQGLQRTAPSNLKAMLKFKDLSLKLKLKSMKVTVKGKYTTEELPGEQPFEVMKKNVSLNSFSGLLGALWTDSTKEITFATTSDETKTAEIVLKEGSSAEPDNSGGSNPYPLFCTPNASELADKTKNIYPLTATSVTATLDHATLDLLDTDNVIPDGAKITALTEFTIEPEEMTVTVTQMDFPFRGAVLFWTRNNADSTTTDIGLDYVRSRETPLSWPKTAGTTLDLVLNQNASSRGFFVGLMRNYDPRQNLNNDDWKLSDDTAPVMAKAVNYGSPTDAEIVNVMETATCTGGQVNGTDDFVPNGKAPESGDTETVTGPAWTTTGHLSTAFIRNAPMMSPWEIGLIHRGIKWQTINIKSAGYPGQSGKTVTTVGMKPATTWNEAGTAYDDGDGAILDQVKMTEEILTYGKINVNNFRLGGTGFDPTNDKNIVQALFEGLPYNREMGDFITASSRGSNGKFPDPSDLYPSTTSLFLKDANAEAIFNLFKTNAMTYPVGLSSSEEEQKSGAFANRAQFLNWGIDGNYLESAFGQVSSQTTDAQQEEIIGRTVNLLTATPSTPSQVQIVVIAQAITDVEGMQYKTASDTSGYTATGGSDPVSIDGDKMASKNCATGQFDAYIHGSDDNKNVYFDEITGEVKMFVTLDRDTVTGRMMIRKIDYIE